MPLNTEQLNEWFERINSARERREQWRDLWAAYCRLHTNAYRAVVEANDDTLAELPSGDQVKLGLVYRNIEQTLGLLEVPEVGFRAELQDFTVEIGRPHNHAAQVVEAALERSTRESGLLGRTEEVDYLKRDGLMIGHAINFTGYRVDEEQVDLVIPVLDQLPDGTLAPAIDENGQPLTRAVKRPQIIYEGVEDRHILPTEFLFDAASNVIEKSPWHGFEDYVPLKALKSDPRYRIPRGIKTATYRRRDIYAEDAEYEIREAVHLVVIYDKARRELMHFIEGAFDSTNTTPKRRRRKRGKDKSQLIPIAYERFPIRFSHPDDSPFSIFVPIPANDIPWGISQVEHIRNPAVEADKIRTRRANLVRQMRRIPWYMKGRLDADQLAQAYNSSQVTPVGLDIQEDEKADQLFGELPFPRPEPEMFDESVQAEDDVRKATGVAEVPFGGADTATESENQMFIGGARTNRKRRLYLAFLAKVAHRHLDYLREYAPDGQMIQAVGADGAQMLLPYGRDALQGNFRIKCEAGGEAAHIPPAQQKMITDVYPLIAQKFGPVFDRLLLRQLLTTLRFPDINALVNAANVDLAMQLQLMGAGPGSGVTDPSQLAASNAQNFNNGQAQRQAINAAREG